MYSMVARGPSGGTTLWRRGENVIMKTDMQAGDPANHQIKRSNLQQMKGDFMNTEGKNRAGKKAGQVSRAWIGVLPIRATALSGFDFQSPAHCLSTISYSAIGQPGNL